MSWSFRFVGERSKVKEAVEKFDQNLNTEEHAAMVATKAAILSHLSIGRDGEGVEVEASGSCYPVNAEKTWFSGSMKVNRVDLLA